jgi:nicotinate phosphoribosyltransferase
MNEVIKRMEKTRSKSTSTAEGILYTDFYQLTMAQLYYRMGFHEKRASFDFFFRSYPDYGAHKAGYCINAGLEWLVNWMLQSRFGEEEIEYLRSLKNLSGKPIFADDFLKWLSEHGNFNSITMRAIPEGRVIHPFTPLVTVQGPLLIGQLLETPLLNKLTYPILIATKASRIKESGQRQSLLEFGLRRAQEGAANAGARAALIGGADFTSNVGISSLLGYPPKGTHAHSMVQVFLAQGGSELDSFRAYAEIYPDDCVLLVDTINTLESGVPNAIKVFEELLKKGHKPVGIRLDSGDLAFLSIHSAKMLDEAGFPDTKIVLSNQLDELVIWQIITQIQEEAPKYYIDPDHLINRLVYGVGTSLITSKGSAAFDGVYKLSALQNEGKWVPTLKLSETLSKVTNPGDKRVWRIYDNRNKATADLIGLEGEQPEKMTELVLYHPVDQSKYRKLTKEDISQIELLPMDIMVNGELVYDFPPLEEIRLRKQADLERLDPGIMRLVMPHNYHVSLSERLWQLKQELIQEHQKISDLGLKGELIK